jgi:hypothetical protein
MSVIIIGGGRGRSAIRRFELASVNAALDDEQVTLINDKLADLEKIANSYNCPEDDGCWPESP